MKQEYLIKKWLNDELSPEEHKAFKALDDFRLNKAIIDNAQHFKAEHFTEIPSLQSLESRLDNKAKVRKLNWIQPLMRVASVAVLAIGVYFFFFYSSMTEVQTLAGEKTTIELPDRSQVILNSMSEISFNEGKWEDKRQVELEGEAFFKVAKGEQFDVVTDQGTISVLGTQFNVKQRENYFEVRCYEGLVRVQTKDTIKKLAIGETLRIYDGLLSFSTTTYPEPQWTRNSSSFKSVPYYQVLAEIERQYNIIIEYSGEKKFLLFTGGFVHDSLENALNSISEPLELTYKIDSSNQVRLLKSESEL